MTTTPTRRTYAQNCGLARALDVVGERWTMLLVRELTLGPRRFNDLAASLPGIGPNLLADRLKMLEANAMVERTVLPAPANVDAYRLTERGEAIQPALKSLALWGYELIADGAEDRTTRASWIVQSMAAVYESDPEPGLELRANLLIDDEALGVTVAGERADVSIATLVDAELVVRCRLETLLAVASGATDLATALDRRELEVDGDPRRLARLLSRFRLPLLHAQPQDVAPA